MSKDVFTLLSKVEFGFQPLRLSASGRTAIGVQQKTNDGINLVGTTDEFYWYVAIAQGINLLPTTFNLNLTLPGDQQTSGGFASTFQFIDFNEDGSFTLIDQSSSGDSIRNINSYSRSAPNSYTVFRYSSSFELIGTLNAKAYPPGQTETERVVTALYNPK